VPEHLEGGAEPKLSGIVFYSIFSHPQVVSVYSLILPGWRVCLDWHAKR